MENLVNIVQFIGGFGMFLYGMNVMADGLQKAAGDRMKNLLAFLTGKSCAMRSLGKCFLLILGSAAL